MTPYRVLVVDDSKFMRTIISDLIEKDPRFRIAGTANNGREAISLNLELKPDVITMDVEMPEMNGLEALKAIMAEQPKPVIMLSGINEQGMKETIEALESGAFDFIRKPSVTSEQDIEQVGRQLVRQLNAAMQAKERRRQWEEEEAKRREDARQAARQIRTAKSKTDSIPASLTHGQTNPPSISTETGFSKKEAVSNSRSFRDRPSSASGEKGRKADPGRNREKGRAETATLKTLPALQTPVSVKSEAAPRPSPTAAEYNQPPAGRSASLELNQLVAVGCSTGGPRALKTLLERIPADFPAPIVIVQHMPPSFTQSLAQRLDGFSPLRVMEGRHGLPLEPGCAYIAPGGSHMTVSRTGAGNYQLVITKGEPRNGHRPSVDVLFESLLPLTSLKRHAVLMTGMGSDGARMMKKLYDAGVTSTFAESEETCVVYGMPRSAVELGGVSHVVPLHQIAARLVQAVNNGK